MNRYRGKKVLIFGLGQFGGQIEAARFFCREGARVLATDLKDEKKLGRAIEALRDLPVELRLGEHRETDFLEADLVVVSPAVPKHSPFYRILLERRIPFTTELALTLERLRAPVYAVTGSNGKSTVTTLLGRVVETSGRRTFVGGNIGRPLLNEVDAIRPEDRAVLELSSFQLEDLAEAAADGAPRFAPDLALVTNLTPNHLDRHGTFEAYVAAKRTLVLAQRESAAAVLNREDARVLAFREATRARIFTYGLEPRFDGPGTFVRDGLLWARDASGRERPLVEARAMRIPGRHNIMNALGVGAAALALGLDLEACGRAIATFPGLRDRLETVAERRHVRFVNDSKATTPEAAVAAIESFDAGLTLIAGGSDKGMDFSPFARAAAERARRVFLIGSTRERLREAVERAAREIARDPPPDVAVEDTLEGAVSRAAWAAEPGSTVLFSPACASYDMFTSFEERGARFRAAVEGLAT